MTRRVCPSSSCRYFCFDTVSSFPHRNSPFQCGYRSTALMYIYIYLYMTIFKVYLLDFYPRVVETRHPYPRNPYPCARVWVRVQLEIPRGYPCHSLPIPPSLEMRDGGVGIHCMSPTTTTTSMTNWQHPSLAQNARRRGWLPLVHVTRVAAQFNLY